MYDIRDVDPNFDFEAVAQLLLKMQSESPHYSQYEPNEDFLAGVFSLMLTPSGFGKVVVINNQLVGIMLGCMTMVNFVKASAATEIVLYVDKENRNGSIGVKLIKLFEQFAALNNADVISVGVSAEIDDDRACNFYTKLGYVPKGRSFLKEYS